MNISFPALRGFAFAAVAFAAISCSKKPAVDYEQVSALQDQRIPLFSSQTQNKSALLFLPHSDDEIVFGGAIDQLKKQGWTVSLVTLTKGQSPEEKQTREAEWNQAVKTMNLDHHQLLDLPNNSWENVLSNNIRFWYDNTDSLEALAYAAIQQYQPSLVFTYDTALGAYGHPEHRVAALAIASVVKKHQAEPGFPVERVLQVTLPENMEQAMLGSLESYAKAKEVTGNHTLPQPTVAFNIRNSWPVKHKAAQAYKSQAGTLQKFLLLPAPEDTAAHYAALNREYYYELK